jgi:hypothetical protein
MTKYFIAIVTGLAFFWLAKSSFTGIPEKMVACWPLATVVSAGLLALGLAQRDRSDK